MANERILESHRKKISNGQWSQVEVAIWHLRAIARHGLIKAVDYYSPQKSSLSCGDDGCLQSLVRAGRLIPLWQRVPDERVDQLIDLACRAPLFKTSNLPSQSSSAGR